MKKTLSVIAALGTLGLAAPSPATAQEFYVGQIIMGGWSFCPRGTAEANGQLIAINTNQSLYALYGTTYGGDGRVNFALPDLRGRIPVNAGQGPGLANRPLGSRGGAESATLTEPTMPSHTHTATAGINALAGAATSGSPSGALLGSSLAAARFAAPGGATVPMASNMASVTVGNSGGSQPFSLMNPYSVITYCVSLVGIFPSRS